MKRAFWAILSASLMCGHLVSAQDNSAAQNLWQRVLAAKASGRPPTALNNFLVVSRRERTLKQQDVDLCLFPNSYWRWTDVRDSPIGVHVRVSDGTGEWESFAEVGDRKGGRGLVWHPPYSSMFYVCTNNQAMFLMETPWLKPRNLSIGTARIGREEFDTITADFGIHEQFKYKYYVDRRTLLVRRVAMGREAGHMFEGRLLPSSEYFDFEDYHPVDGVLMPSKVTTRYTDRRGTEVRRYEFGLNVEFDPTIFTRRPTIEEGSEGWRPKVRIAPPLQ